MWVVSGQTGEECENMAEDMSMDSETTTRACLECEAVYVGRLDCPACEKASGEPLDGISEDVQTSPDVQPHIV